MSNPRKDWTFEDYEKQAEKEKRELSPHEVKAIRAAIAKRERRRSKDALKGHNSPQG